MSQKEGNETIGRGMFGRGIKLKDFFPFLCRLFPCQFFAQDRDSDVLKCKEQAIQILPMCSFSDNSSD
jgi:hypothetical protein